MIDKLKYHAPAIIVVVAALAFGALLFYTTNKSTPTTKPEISVNSAADKNAKMNPPKQYTYTTQSGDSYTLLARKTIQSYVKSVASKLSPAQIIAAETFLTQQAGAPELDINQKIVISTSDVQSAFTKARGLSSQELAAWQDYVPYVQL